MFKLAIFDLDGTLVKQKIDFEKLKKELACPHEEPLLEYIESLSPPEREKAETLLEHYEDQAARNAEVKPGIKEALDFLHARGICTAIFTRNSNKSLQTALQRCGLSFDMLVSREDAPPKPSPEPVLLICKKLGIPPDETIVIGDFRFDIESGKAAGAKTVLIKEGESSSLPTPSDYFIEDTRDLTGLFQCIFSRRA